MTTIDPVQHADLVAEAVPLPDATRWDRLDAWLQKASDRLNPILVKEARQALRSRQFVITFLLMLAAGWLWSFLGLASIGPSVYYSAEGPKMLFVYHMILSFPLLVVAPYSAFHSLSSERQDRTYELLSITALGARQILAGKMCAILLQMMVYLSAIFPCLAFTYLLRGLDIFTIVLVVTYTCLLSLALSVTGLLLGAIAPLRQRHIGVSVVLALILFGALFLENVVIFQLIYFGGLAVVSTQFWIAQWLVASIFVNYFAVVFLAARSQLLTISENRSTALRWSLVAAQLTFIVWMVYLTVASGEPEVMMALIYFSALFWFVCGTFLAGEAGNLSPRVKRDLPQSLLGRAFLTWFTPGPGTGAMFVLSNMLAVSLVTLLPYHAIGEALRNTAAARAGAGMGPNMAFYGRLQAWLSPREYLAAATVALCYLVIYLGIGSLIIRWLRKYVDVKLALPVVVNVILMMFGCITPWVIQMTSPALRRSGWTLLQIPNAAWTMMEVCFGNGSVQMEGLLLALVGGATVVWLLNLLPLLDELRQVRIAPPARVQAEDAAIAAELAVPEGPKSPWDDGVE
jgi:hypothetical protein